MSRIVLAYSGGLDTSVLLKKLVLEGHEVVAMTVDLGESDAIAGEGAKVALEAARAKAIALGAYDAVLLDARARFIDEYAFAALRANALYEGVYPLSAALSRPLIAELLVETARRYGADAVAHGCTGKGNDQVRIELAVRALDPDIVCRAPLRESPLSRPDAIAFARAHGVPVSHTAERPYSIDANLWGRSIEAGVLEDPWCAPPEDAFAWTSAPESAPAQYEEIVVTFVAGLPSVDELSSAPLVARLNALGGRHGVGRIDLVEDRVVGFKSREVYECPASVTLIAANRALERLVLTRDELRFKALVDQRYAELIYDGLWMQPLRAALDGFIATFAARMSGEVRLRLHRGSCAVTGARSPHSLYRQRFATYGNGDAFDHRAADGFIALHALPLEAVARGARAEAIPA
ncbi:MAG TPA: argininosuccinate synthase [Candidatus Cybelea sp.]|jgi:argininosuccinate synthase|nr:argininosuccinate synthase [Candidatus Cybelea sp.]